MGSREGRTEQPTEKRRRDARRKGQSAVAQDLAPWTAVLVGTHVLPSAVAGVGRSLERTWTTATDAGVRGDGRAAVGVLTDGLWGAFVAVLPLLAVVAATGALVHLSQSAGAISLHGLRFDVTRVSPKAGIRRLLSPRNGWDTVKQVSKAVVVTLVAWPRARGVLDALLERRRQPVDRTVVVAGDSLIGLVRAVAWTMIALALADYAVARRRHRADLRMTKQEVKEEMRHSEGDQMVKGRIRQIQSGMARRRMMSAVPTADVVVTNPTHIAVALAYDPLSDAAPRVVAVGLGAVAARIRATAATAGVPVVEAKPLARALWRSCDVGDAVPSTLYEAVARVLVFVRRLRRDLLGTGTLELPPGYRVDPDVLDGVVGRRRTPSAGAA